MEITRELLFKLYFVEKRTTIENAQIFGKKSPQTISNYLKKYDISTRQGRDAQVNKYEITKGKLDLKVSAIVKCENGVKVKISLR